MRRKLRRVLFLIMTVIITFVGCGESNKTKTVDKKASIATEEKKSDDLINNQKKEEMVEMEQESFEKETIKKEDAKKEDSKKNDAKKDTSKQENTVQNDSKKNDSKSDSKKKETSNKTNPSTSNKKQETTKPSVSASTPAKPATNSGIADPSSNVAEQQDVTDGDKEPEKNVEKDLETERQMKQLLKEIGVGFAESDAQANTSSMPRRAKAARAAGDVINTGRIKSNSIGRIDVINYNDPSWPQLLTWREGLLGNTDTKEPLFCADPMDSFKAGKKTGVDASTIYNKETIQTVAAMMYYYDHYMCKSINSDYEYLMKQCAVWWVLNAVHGWFADGVQIETGNGVKCACGTWLSTHKGDYYANGLVWAWENYKYFTDAKGVIYQGNGQPLSSWSGTYNPSGYAKLKKSSSDTSITNGNACYSLKDAVYGVYSEKSLSGASKVGTLTTDANGDSNTLTLTAGTYYVKEVTAPKGYALDKTTYTITVKSGETSILKVSDKPTMDPVGVLLGKVDKETNLNKPEGSLPLKGALFKVKFYAGVQMDSDPAASGKTVTKKWVFRTDADGFAYYDSQYLVSGDELYTGPTGSKQLPLGTITIKETQAPEGYLINPTVYTVKITSENNGSEFVYTYNEPTIAEQSLDLNIVKKEKGKDYPPDARAYICGVASIQVLGLTIHGITIKQGQKGYFINMPQYKKADGYHDVIYATGKVMQEKIAEAVLKEYKKTINVPNFGTKQQEEL